jgi:putative nucleotidyltransferase with HDIG domain
MVEGKMVRVVSGHEVEALRYELLLKEIIASAEKLPPFPDIVWKVMPLIQKTASAKEIEAVIKYDPVITAKVIALSQSPYYARRHSINSLSDAVVLLGSQRLIQVILTASASRYFEKRTSKSDTRDLDLWRHSVATGVMGEILARRLGHTKALKIYLAALLHDIGKTVLNHYNRIYLGSTLSDLTDVQASSVDLERRSLGIDHQGVGKIVARRWRFPSEVITAIAYHHHPHEAPNYQDVAFIVYAANYLASIMEADEIMDNLPAPENDMVFQKLGITGPMAERFLAQLHEAMLGIRQFLASESESAPHACGSNCRAAKSDAGMELC